MLPWETLYSRWHKKVKTSENVFVSKAHLEADAHLSLREWALACSLRFCLSQSLRALSSSHWRFLRSLSRSFSFSLGRTCLPPIFGEIAGLIRSSKKPRLACLVYQHRHMFLVVLLMPASTLIFFIQFLIRFLKLFIKILDVIWIIVFFEKVLFKRLINKKST